MTNYNPIILGVSSGKEDNAQSLSAEKKQSIFLQDDHTCQFCGFRSEKYQEIHALGGKSDNLVTSCIFCNQCFSLEKTGQMRSGILIWMPEIEQAALHHIMRAIYVGRISQGPMADAARKALDIFMERRAAVRDRLGTDAPDVLATVLKDYIAPRTYSFRDKKLEGVRLLPLDRRIIKEGDLEFNQFPQILAYWRSKAGPFGGTAPAKWLDVYAETFAQHAA